MYGISNIRKKMSVYGSCGRRLGRVARIGSSRLRVAVDRAAERIDLPLECVDWVGRTVHLGKSCEEAERDALNAKGD
jgi:hypothetical protein